jgi:hypothetical protein
MGFAVFLLSEMPSCFAPKLAVFAVLNALIHGRFMNFWKHQGRSPIRLVEKAITWNDGNG